MNFCYFERLNLNSPSTAVFIAAEEAVYIEAETTGGCTVHLRNGASIRLTCTSYDAKADFEAAVIAERDKL